MAFALFSGARHSLHRPNGRTSNDVAGFASCYGPLSRSPLRAFDTELRPDPFPAQAASLLAGLLTATRPRLTPASDDERTTKDHLNKVTSDLLVARKFRARVSGMMRGDDRRKACNRASGTQLQQSTIT
jgi:hypothetical protein